MLTRWLLMLSFIHCACYLRNIWKVFINRTSKVFALGSFRRIGRTWYPEIWFYSFSICVLFAQIVCSTPIILMSPSTDPFFRVGSLSHWTCFDSPLTKKASKLQTFFISYNVFDASSHLKYCTHQGLHCGQNPDSVTYGYSILVSPDRFTKCECTVSLWLHFSWKFRKPINSVLFSFLKW